MKTENFLTPTPLPLIFLITIVVIFLSIAIGYYFGNRFRQRRKSDNKLSVGSIVGAMLGLLAFVLAFTFSLTYSRYENRKQLLLDEVNAIGTAVLRTDFLPEPSRTESKKLFKEYVNIRVEADKNRDKLPQALIASEAIQDKLWSLATIDADYRVQDSRLMALYLDSLNETIDLHSERVVVALQYRIPRTVWFLLYFITVQAMLAVGYEFGLNGSVSFLASLLLALMFASVLIIIKDLDRAGIIKSSFLQVSQKPMIELQQKLNTSID